MIRIPAEHQRDPKCSPKRGTKSSRVVWSAGVGAAFLLAGVLGVGTQIMHLPDSSAHAATRQHHGRHSTTLASNERCRVVGTGTQTCPPVLYVTHAGARATATKTPAPVKTATPKPTATSTTPPATTAPKPTTPPASNPTSVPTTTMPAAIPSTGTTSNGCQITSDQAGAEQYLLNLLNQHRAVAGSAPLKLNSTLSVASRQHSCDMFEHQNMSHSGSDGSTPDQRYRAVGISYSSWGENIGWASGYGLDGGINWVDNQMMAEPLNQQYDHHWNIVHSGFTQVGIGIIYVNGQVWLTEDFIG